MKELYNNLNSDLFRKVLYRKYVCSDCTLMIVYNLNNHVSAIRDDLSANLFEALAAGSRENVDNLMTANNLTSEDISSFIEDLLKA